MTTETPRQQLVREMAESAKRRRTAMSKEQRKIAEAGEITDKEAEELEAADKAVVLAEAEVYKVRRRLADLERAAAPHTKIMSSGVVGPHYETVRDSQAVARLKAAKPDLVLDLQSASNDLQLAIRERNRLTARISQARTQRRMEAERKYGPKPTKPVLRSDPWKRKADDDFGRAA